MTIKKAIEIVLNRGVGYTVEDGEIAFNMAIKALEQEQSGDAISRQMAIVALDNKMSSLENVGMRIAMKIAKDIIHDLPPVNPQEPKTGHWEWLTEDKYRCSNCNSETKVDECLNEPMYEFCPFCGCPMVGEEV